MTGFLILSLGLALWMLPHLFKRLMPARRAALGDKARGPVALAVLGGVILMVIGYRMADFIPVYTPIPGIGHLNNLLMLFSVYCFGIAPTKGLLANRIRHPMLTGVVIFAGAHLLVNGDVASLILFGGLGLWALLEMALINRTTGAWVRPPAGSFVGDLKNIVGTLIIYGVAVGIHALLGHSPFLGTYG